MRGSLSFTWTMPVPWVATSTCRVLCVCQLVRAPGVKVTSVALVRDGACGVASESCSTVPVKLLAGAAFVFRLAAVRILTSSMPAPLVAAVAQRR